MSEPALFAIEPGMRVIDGTSSPDTQEQWRLAEVQIANWGTFDTAIHRIPISRRGHLITGPSGSGKSSLLDAIAAVLTPDKWLRFNVAAQTAGTRTDQRSIVSYVRGAWTRTTDADEDRVVSKYLRPRATWSGIVLRYENGEGKPLTLARLFFIKGTGTRMSDLSDLCLLDRAAVDLDELQSYAIKGLEARKLKSDRQDALVTSNGGHSKFYSRMRREFGIHHESALQLLHKTQSAKSLDSLDQLFRDHMLERPATFGLADTAVEQFGDLRDAHDHVVQLRLQRDHLLQLKSASTRFDTSAATVTEALALAASVMPYQKRRELALLRADTSALEEKVVGLEVDVERVRTELSQAAEEYESARRASLELGGAETEYLQQRIESAEATRRSVADRWGALRRQLEQAGIDNAPTSAAEFAELQAQIACTLDAGAAGAAGTAGTVGADGGGADGAGADGKEAGTSATGPTHAEHDRFSTARRRVAEIEREIDSLRRSGSTVPTALLEVRRQLADGTGLSESSLPFVAELIEVRRDFAQWSGAIERVLRPFALTVLVRPENLATVRSWVDAHRIRARLVFEQIVVNPGSPKPAHSEKSLVNRVEVADSGFGDWVAVTLAERYDIACVDSPDELDDHPRAVTIKGQFKTSRTRYEKDDRRAIDDRSQWVLGNRDAKLEALIELLHEAQAELAAAEEIVRVAQEASDREHRTKGILAGIREQSWKDVDRLGAENAVTVLAEQLAKLEDADGDLQKALRAEKKARGEKDTAEQAFRDADFAMRSAHERLGALTETMKRLVTAIDAGQIPEVDAAVSAKLEQRFRSVQRSITRESLPEVGQKVAEALSSQKDKAQSQASEAGREVTRLAAEFKAEWSSVASDLTADVEDRHDFLRMLDEIEAHGLPDHETRFRDLLRQRSSDLIGELVNEILGAPHEIQDRVDPINTSLRRSQFDEDRFLELQVKVRRSETVNAFIADMRSISSGSWGDEDMATAESKYDTLAEIMRRLDSSEHIDRVWRTQCLDTRLHVSFLAKEVDESGTAHATYDSGAAMSGGQQQKLVIFCLAAALRYQLADPDEAVSRYGTIILDEAFDKADTRYTRMALDVFLEFGFHMVLATPQKLLQTIEPYVGAATSVENPTRRKSVVATMTWEDADAAAVEGAAGGDASAGEEEPAGKK